MSLVFKADPVRGERWRQIFMQMMPEITFTLWSAPIVDPSVRYLVCWQPPEDITSLYPNLEVIFSVGAGIDQFDLAALPPRVQLVKMAEPGIAEQMAEYVTYATLALHRQMPQYLEQQRRGQWRERPNIATSDCRVGVMGLGMLGRRVLDQLSHFKFQLAGWSRTSVQLEGVDTYAGSEQLSQFLNRTDLLICLIPLTDETRGILNCTLFEQLPQGASIINVGRGEHLDQADLLKALESGQLNYAFLDVTTPEPLPEKHPFWSHPKIQITPHIASMTDPDEGARTVIANLKRVELGQPMLGLIDKQRGY